MVAIKIGLKLSEQIEDKRAYSVFYPRYSTLDYIMFPFILSSALACIHQPVYFSVFVVACTRNSVSVYSSSGVWHILQKCVG